MNKFFVLLVALLLSASAIACDVRCGPGYSHGGAGYYDQHRGGRHGQSIGRQIAEEGIGAAVAVAAIQVGAAVGTKLAQEISGTPAQQQVQTRVVYVATCDRTPFISGGLVYADRCDGSGLGPVVVGRIDRR